MLNVKFPIILFFECWFPRILLAAIFSIYSYNGEGGDSYTYHLLGRFLVEYGFNFDVKTLVVYFQQNGVDAADYLLKSLEKGEFLTTLGPVVLIHYVVYSVWNNPFAFVIVTSGFSAYANTVFIKKISLSRNVQKWIIYNPVSIYYAATHNKESITEAFFILLICFVFAERSKIKSLFTSLIIVLFRYTSAIAVIVVMFYKIISKFSVGVISGSLFLAILLLPSLQWEVKDSSTAGPLFSMVYSNELTKKILGTIVGILQPIPFVIVGFNTPQFILFNIYGILYNIMLFYIMMAICTCNARSIFLKIVIILNIAISYWVVGQMSKPRFFAPFFPLMIVVFWSVKPRVDCVFLQLFKKS